MLVQGCRERDEEVWEGLERPGRPGTCVPRTFQGPQCDRVCDEEQGRETNNHDPLTLTVNIKTSTRISEESVSIVALNARYQSRRRPEPHK